MYKVFNVVLLNTGAVYACLMSTAVAFAISSSQRHRRDSAGVAVVLDEEEAKTGRGESKTVHGGRTRRGGSGGVRGEPIDRLQLFHDVPT